MNAWSVWDIFRITRAVINGKAGCDLPRKEPQGSHCLRLNENTGRTYRSNHFSFSNKNKGTTDYFVWSVLLFLIAKNYIQHTIPFCLTKSYKSRIFCSNLCVDLGKLPLSFEKQNSKFIWKYYRNYCEMKLMIKSVLPVFAQFLTDFVGRFGNFVFVFAEIDLSELYSP